MAKQPITEWPGRYRHLSFWWSTAIGIGLLKPAPGTWGSFAALVSGYFMIAHGLSFLSLVTLITMLTFISIWAINTIEKKSGIHDAGEIVIDEVAGQWLALSPLCFFSGGYVAYFIAFFLFRLFDIWKPWPIGPVDKHVNGGFGVMVDDLIAGAFSAVILWALLFYDLLPI